MTVTHFEEIELDEEFYQVEGQTEWEYDPTTKTWEFVNSELSVVNVYDEKDVDKEIVKKVIDMVIDNTDPYYEHDQQETMSDDEYNMER